MYTPCLFLNYNFYYNVVYSNIYINYIACLCHGIYLIVFYLIKQVYLWHYNPRSLLVEKTRAGISMVIKFLVGPAVILATSKAMGIHGVLLHVTIIQVKQIIPL